MNFTEISKKLLRLLEQEQFTKQQIIAIRGQAVDSKYNIDPEDILDEDEVRSVTICGNQVYTIDHIDDIYVCSLDTFKDIISNLVSNFINSIPDGFEKYLNRNQLEQDTLADKITLQQLFECCDDNSYGSVIDFEEVNYNNQIYIVMEVS